MRPALPLITDILALRSFVRRKLPYSDRTQAIRRKGASSSISIFRRVNEAPSGAPRNHVPKSRCLFKARHVRTPFSVLSLLDALAGPFFVHHGAQGFSHQVEVGNKIGKCLFLGCGIGRPKN
jgi:hypothetical protein